jgi:cytochrome P450
MLDLEEVGALNALMTTFPTLFKIAYSSYLPIPFIREGTQALFRIRQYSQESIRRYQNIVAADPHNAKPTFFTKLMQPGEGHLTEEEVIPEAQTFIVAGTDTTAHTLAYLVWAMCKNADMKRKLVEEVAALSEGYNDEDLKKLPYLNQVIQETLRLWASVPSGLPREVPNGGCEIDGYFMPDGTTVCTQAYSMHRNPEVFSNSERYVPDGFTRISTSG